MLYLLWGILNIALFLTFIFICYRATKFLREKLGLFASLIFVFGLLSFVGNSGYDKINKEPFSNQIKTWEFIASDSLNKNNNHFVGTTLEKTLISKYELGIKYGTDKEGTINIPISANSSTTGFVSGTSWEPSSIIVNRTNNNEKFKYHVGGTLRWALLGMTIYLEGKEYTGIISTKQASR
jgi:hypothetical protein